MKIEFKYLKEKDVKEEKSFVVYLILSLILICIYGAWIAILLDSNFLLIALPIGGFMLLLILTNILSRMSIKRIK